MDRQARYAHIQKNARWRSHSDVTQSDGRETEGSGSEGDSGKDRCWSLKLRAKSICLASDKGTVSGAEEIRWAEQAVLV